MSRAFVKEDDSEDDDLPGLPERTGPNYITTAGKAQLEEAIAAIEAEIAELGPAGVEPAKEQRRVSLKRAFRRLQGRLESATIVDHSANSPAEILFGAEVTAVEADGKTHVFTIVGEDETDLDSGRISWASPLAESLLGRKAGDKTLWHRPAGDLELEITRVAYHPA